MTNTHNNIASFAAGCFWGVEATFAALKGVIRTTVGYAGGHLANPSYQAVCTGTTGHAETLQLTFDPKQICYQTLLHTFWECHDPTTPDRQGPDVGSQYRSVIFYHNPTQQRLAEASKVMAQTRISKPIVTAIIPMRVFYPAENDHQQYFKKHAIQYCPLRKKTISSS